MTRTVAIVRPFPVRALEEARTDGGKVRAQAKAADEAAIRVISWCFFLAQLGCHYLMPRIRV